MSNIKEQIKSVFNKYGIDPSTVGIKFEEETATEAAATEVKFAVEGTLSDGTKIYSTADDAEIEREEQSTEMSSEDLVAVIGSLSERIAVLEAEKTELAAAVESAKKDADAVKAELASVKKAPAVPSVKSQEFKKNNAPVVASNGNSFSDFMEQIRAKKVN